MGAFTPILFFVEDPGAANFIAPLIPALRTHGHHPGVIATGIAMGTLKQRGVDFEMPISTETNSEILKRIEPRVLVVGTASDPDTRGLLLIEAARHAGIPAVGVVDAAMNSGLRFMGRSDNPLAYAPDWILVPDDVTRNSFLELSAKSERVLVLGHPHYDFIRGLAESWVHEPHAHFRNRIYPEAAGRAVVVFVSEGSARVAPVTKNDLSDYTLHGRGGANGRTEIVLEELIDALAGVTPRPYFVLRIHPRDEEKDYVSYSGMIDKISKDEPALEVVYAADLVVGMTSMLLNEAALLGGTVLPIIPRKTEIEWLPLTRSGTLTAATTRSDISKYLHRLLSNTGDRLHATVLRHAYPEGATDRIARFLHGMIGAQSTG